MEIRVVPKAAKERLSVENGKLKAWVRAAPEKGQANLALVALVSDWLGVSKSCVRLVKGQKSRDKCVAVAVSQERIDSAMVRLQQT